MTAAKRKRIRKSGTGKVPLWLKQGVVVLLLALAVWLNWSQVRSFMIKPLLRYHQVDTGVVTRELAVEDAVVVRDETVLFAPLTGTLKRVVPEGQRVAEGETIAYIRAPYGGSQPLMAARPGVVSYYTDGLENVLSPETVETINLSELDGRSPARREALDGATVERGEPVAKIVDNLQPFLLWLQFDVEHLVSFPSPGRKISLYLGEGQYQAQVVRVTARGIQAEAILNLQREDLLWDRQVAIRLILAQEKGLAVPNGALVMQETQPGVYKETATGLRLVPVTVKLQNEEWSIVEGLDRGDRVVTNPHLLFEE